MDSDFRHCEIGSLISCSFDWFELFKWGLAFKIELQCFVAHVVAYTCYGYHIKSFITFLLLYVFIKFLYIAGADLV